jgi:hypothetical protein
VGKIILTSVVMWVMRARFLTRPQLSPSGVSLGQSIPHWEGWSDRGPLTFRVFSNWEFTLHTGITELTAKNTTSTPKAKQREESATVTISTRASTSYQHKKL